MNLDISPSEFAQLMFVEAAAVKRSQGYHSTKEQCGNCAVYGEKCGNRNRTLDYKTWDDVPEGQRGHMIEVAQAMIWALERRLSSKT